LPASNDSQTPISWQFGIEWNFFALQRSMSAARIATRMIDAVICTTTDALVRQSEICNAQL